MQVVGFSHWWCCGFHSSGMWWHVTGPVVSDVSKFSNIVCSFRTPVPLKITAQHPFKRSGTTFPVMQNHIPKSHNPLLMCLASKVDIAKSIWNLSILTSDDC